MKKILVVFAAVIVSMSQLFAQEDMFVKGDKAVNLGLGFGSVYWGVGYKSSFLPVSASFEMGILDGLINGKGSVGVGAYLGYSSTRIPDVWKFTNLVIGPRGAFHYPLVENLDTYAGVAFGLNISSDKYIGTLSIPNDNTVGVFSSGFLGARYHFSESFAAMAEVGYTISYLTLGVALKF